MKVFRFWGPLLDAGHLGPSVGNNFPFLEAHVPFDSDTSQVFYLDWSSPDDPAKALAAEGLGSRRPLKN